MSRKSIISIVFIVLTIILAINLIVPIKERYLEFKYDRVHTNNSVTTENEISEILNSFKSIKFDDLSSKYKESTKSDDSNYIKLLSSKRYKEITSDDFFKKLVGDFRIKDFVCKDTYYNNSIKSSENKYYWLIDEKLPKAVLSLQQELSKMGYDHNGFKITYGHRSPIKNEQVKGAKSSKHIMGQAVDIVIQDIDRDGKYTEKDKNIVLDIAERIVIGNNGGIGRYPGTRIVHLDVRGSKARWDSY